METYAIIFASTFTLIGLGILIFGIKYLQKARATLQWPKAEGRIIRSRVADWYDSDGDTMYGAQIEYAYIVDGYEYHGHEVKKGTPQTSSPDPQEKIVARYPRGAAVMVTYDPENITDAVLEPGAAWGAYLPLILGIVMTLLAGSMLYSLLTSEWTVGT